MNREPPTGWSRDVHSDGSESDEESMAIAVVGMAGRFPGAGSVTELWTNLCAGRDSIRRFQPDELLMAGVPEHLVADDNYVPASPVLDGCELFDAFFFGYSPRDAELMDPQHRLFLECAWHALENAGYDARRFSGKIGIFGGAAMNTYLLYSDVLAQFEDEYIPTLIGLDKDYVTTRVAYKLDLTGPAITVQTACSTSLVAAHLACQSLYDEECDIALIGGISIRVPQTTGYLYRPGGVLSPNGRVRAFDQQARGTIFGSGVGVCVLRRAQDAIAAGDTIHGLILGSAVNNDGSNKVDFTAPSVGSQSEVIAEAMANAEVEARDIGYVETHGTGTVIGDQVELAALQQAFADTDTQGFCALGSIKTNIGHLDAAAGTAGLIKAIMAVKHGVLPPSLNCPDPHEQARPENGPFYVNTELRDWPTHAHDGSIRENHRPRRAGVTSLGIGGTNAHLIVEQPPAPAPSGPSRSHQLLLWSACNQRAADQLGAQLADHIDEHRPPLADVAFTLNVGRRAFEHRRALVSVTFDEEPTSPDVAAVVQALRTRDGQRVISGVCPSGSRRLAFMFPGGGAQYPAMAHALYRDEAIFRATIDECAQAFSAHLSEDLRSLLYPQDDVDAGGPGAENRAAATRPALALPALFATEVALARLLQAWGVQPHALIGHSLGEYAAAHIAGVFNLPDACALVALRGRLFETLPAGAMLSTPMSAADLRPLLTGELTIAADNGDRFTVVSGPIASVDRLHATLTARNIETRKLRIDVAAHSPMLAPILDAFRNGVARMAMRAPTIPVVSNVTGTWLTDAQAISPEYWVDQLRHTVRFREGLETLFEEPERILLEVGPGHTLATFARAHTARQKRQWVGTSIRHPKDPRHDLAVLLEALGGLWLAGVELDPDGYWSAQKRRRIPLPGYPFARQRHWLARRRESPAAAVATTARESDAGAYASSPAQSEPGLQTARDWTSVWIREPGSPPQLIGSEPRDWLLFLDDCGVGVAMAERLRSAGQRVLTVRSGPDFQQSDPDSYVASPGSLNDMRALLRTVMEPSGSRSRSLGPIVFLWTIPSPASSPSSHSQHNAEVTDSQSNATDSEDPFWAALALARALTEFGPYHHPVRLCLATTGLVPAPGGAALEPLRALLLGPWRVITREVPNIVATAIDISLAADKASNNRRAQSARTPVADLLITECLATNPTRTVALRGHERWVEKYRRISSTTSVTDPLRAGAVALITGGLGGLGMACAEYLARTYQARIALISRSPIDERTERGQDLHRRIATMESHGAEVLVLHADVASREAMAAALEQSRTHFGPVDVVLHTAGVLADGSLVSKDSAQVADVLRPKVRGTIVLDELLADQDREPLMVLYSSINVHLAPFGQSDYVAANAFMDSFARVRARRAPTVAIDWPGWTETGMAARIARKLALTEPRRDVLRNENPLLTRRLRVSAQTPVQDGANTGDRAVYESDFDPSQDWWFTEHSVRLSHATDSLVSVLPGTAIIELVRAAFADLDGDTNESRPVVLHDLFFIAPLVGSAPCTTRLLMRRKAPASAALLDQSWDFLFVSRTDAAPNWRTHALGRIAHAQPQRASVDISALRIRCPRPLPEGSWSWMDGVHYGPRWHTVTQLSLGNDECLAELRLPSTTGLAPENSPAGDLEQFTVHPAMLDVATAILAHTASGPQTDLYVPYSYGQIRIFRAMPPSFIAHVTRRADSPPDRLVFDGTLYTADGLPVVDFRDFVLLAVAKGSIETQAPPDPSQRLQVAEPGRLASVALVAQAPIAPIGNQVEVSMSACGLNFKDVLHALNLLAPSPLFQDSSGNLRLGMEGTGTILSVGPEVTALRPGDKVMLQAPGTFADSVVVDERFCVPAPETLDMLSSAGLPVAYTTAIYALRHCAHLRAGERVLIHAATGGVGLAAVHVARAQGATILATAGTPAKRDYLRQLGIVHVFDSRSLQFAADARTALGGEGVDVVLNSLGGEFIEHSLSLLRPFGRFCELGLRDIVADRNLAMGAFRRSVTFHAIDMGLMWTERPELLATLLTELRRDIDAGTLPPLPVRSEPLAQAADSFDAMAQATHIGKFVLVPSSATASSSTTDDTMPEWGRALLAELQPATISDDPMTRNLLEGLTTDEGIAALERVMSGATRADASPQVIVSPGDLPTRVREFDDYFAAQRTSYDHDSQRPRSQGARDGHPRPELSTPYVAPDGELERVIADTWAHILGIAEIGVHDRFAELGGDSLKGARVISMVNEQLGCKLSTTDFFAAPTVRALAAHLQAQQSSAPGASGEAPAHTPSDKEQSTTPPAAATGSTRADRRRELMRRRQRSRGRREDSTD